MSAPEGERAAARVAVAVPAPAAAPLPPAVAVLLAAGGPLLLGLVLGVPAGPSAMLAGAVTLPAVVLGTVLLTAPALYIGLTLLGTAPPAEQVLAALGGGLRAYGTLLTGLAPAVAFLVATTEQPLTAYLLGTTAVAAGAVAGLRAVCVELLPAGRPRRGRAALLLGLWALVSLGLGLHFYLSSLTPINL